MMETGPPSPACPTTVRCCTVVPLLGHADLHRVASLLGVEPSVSAVQQAVLRCPAAQARLTGFLFDGSRSQTPPRQMLRAPSTPPPVVRKSRRKLVF